MNPFARHWRFLLLPWLLSAAQGADPLPSSADIKCKLRSAKIVLVGEIRGDKRPLDLSIISIYKGPANPQDDALFRMFVPGMLLSGIYSPGDKVLFLCGHGKFWPDRTQYSDWSDWGSDMHIRDGQVADIDSVAKTATRISLDEIKRL